MQGEGNVKAHEIECSRRVKGTRLEQRQSTYPFLVFQICPQSLVHVCGLNGRTRFHDLFRHSRWWSLLRRVVAVVVVVVIVV